MAMGLAWIIVIFKGMFIWLFRRRAYERYIRIDFGLGGMLAARHMFVGFLFILIFIALYFITGGGYSFVDTPKEKILDFCFGWSCWLAIFNMGLGFILGMLTACGPLDVLWRRKRMSKLDKAWWNNGGKDYIKYEEWYKYAYAYKQWEHRAKAIPFWTWYRKQVWKPSYWIGRIKEGFFRIQMMNEYGY